MKTADVINFLRREIQNPSLGLPDDIFYFVSSLTPLVNVDLLIKDEKNRTLLSWRDDKYAGKGWHIPGGIVRFKETFETRVKKVAETEIGADVSFETVPIAINQCIHHEHDVRGHFISILFKCFLSSEFVPQNKGLSANDAGHLMWHDVCPNNLIKYHEMYKKFI